MKNSIIDLNILELDEGRNPFDELAAKLEQLNLKGADPKKKELLEQQILTLEREYQDLQDVDSEKAKILFQACTANIVMLEANEISSFDVIEKNIKGIAGVAFELKHKKKKDVSSLKLTEVLKSKYKDTSSVSISDLFQIYNYTFSTFSDLRNEKEGLEWTLELNFNTSKDDNHKPLEFIHTLIEGLNTIPGTHVTLEDIRIGSIQAKIKAIFDDATSKEEVKEVLETAKKFAKGKLEKEFHEAERASSEAQKNQIESKILEENLSILKSDETKELKKLETESIRYDIEKKKLENERLKIQLFKERKELLKELLADGFITQKDLEILIQGIPFLKIENGKLVAETGTDTLENI